jgi:DNA-binding transcriptional LysR family regulator
MLFINLVESESFKKTAVSANMQTSTLSKHISSLEQRLGQLLMIRDTRNITITPYGKFIYEKFKHLPAYVDHTIKDKGTNQLFETSSEVLNLQLGTLISHERINSHLQEFRTAFPHVKLNIMYSTTINSWGENTDITLSPQYIEGRQFNNRFVRTEFFQLYCTNQYVMKYGIPLTIDELKNHRVIGGLDIDNKPLDYVTLTNQNTKKDYLFDMRDTLINLNSAMLTKQIGINTDFIFASVESLCLSELRQQSIVKILPEWTAYKVDFYLTSRKKVTQLEQAFIDFIYKCLGREFGDS